MVTGLPLVHVVAAALVDADGRVLVAERPPGKDMAGLWEFPGGKIDPGETPEAALVRELAEELGIDTSASCLAPAGFASHAYAGFHLVLLLFACRKWRGTARGREGQRLRWVRVPDLFALDMPPADRPLLGLLAALL
ncbi:MAG: (deoxy)nucleoside triphosphate pyrophosphohydrolase, partial [Janthinobacterium lividum]